MSMRLPLTISHTNCSALTNSKMYGVSMHQQCGSRQLSRHPCRTGTAAIQRAAHQPCRPVVNIQPVTAAQNLCRRTQKPSQQLLAGTPRTCWGHSRQSLCRASGDEVSEPELPEPLAEIVRAVGEDAAAFSLQDQSISAWGIFTMLLITVLGALYAVWYMTAEDGCFVSVYALSTYSVRFCTRADGCTPYTSTHTTSSFMCRCGSLPTAVWQMTMCTGSRGSPPIPRLSSWPCLPYSQLHTAASHTCDPKVGGLAEVMVDSDTRKVLQAFLLRNDAWE